MQIKRLLLIFATVAAFGLGYSGCSFVSLDDSTVGQNSDIPAYSGGSEEINPWVTGTSSDLKSATDGDLRTYVYFSEDMDSSTINSTNIYLRDVTTTAPAVVTATVTYDAFQKAAVLEYSLTPATQTDIELVVLSAVTDLAGNGLAGDANSYPTFLDEATPAAYRKSLDPLLATVAFFPFYTPARMVITSAAGGAGIQTISVTPSVMDINAASIDQTDFSCGGGTIAAYTENTWAVSATVNAINFITFDCTGLSDNTEYTVTYTPQASMATVQTYPDNTTLLDKTVLFDTYGNNATEKKSSDYVHTFKTAPAATAIPLTVTGRGGKWSKTVWVDFSDGVDATTVMDTANYIVTDSDGDNIQFDIIPYYNPGTGVGTGLVSIDISIEKYNSDPGLTIQQVIIKSTITSAAGVALDGNGDGILQGEADYNEDGTPDDWYIY